MRDGRLVPLRKRPARALAVGGEEALDIAQLDYCRILEVAHRRRLRIVALADAQHARLAVAADDDGAFRAEVDGARAVLPHIKLRRPRIEQLLVRNLHLDAVSMLLGQLEKLPMPAVHIR